MATSTKLYGGSLIINSSVTVDTSTLYIDASTNKVGVGTTQPSQKLEVDGTLKATSLEIGSVTNAFVPSGIIVIWYGDPASLPTGWVLCDGTNSTPDLRDKFVMCSGNTYTKGATGGSANYTLTNSTMPSHSHSASVANNNHYHTAKTEFGFNFNLNFPAPNYQYNQYSYVNRYINNHSCNYTGHSHTANSGNEGSGSAFSILPPYYTLSYIMKV
jgi:microcystin-dependent protein